MYLKAPAFSARFEFSLCGLPAQAEDEFDSLDKVLDKLTAVQAVHPDACLEAVMLHFDLSRQDGKGYHCPDEDTQGILHDICQDLGVRAQHFYNERLAAYDPLNNSLTPLDFGMTLPDGTLKMVWRPQGSRFSIEKVAEVLTAAVNTALAVQNMRYGRETVDEFNSEVPCEMAARRIEVLFEVGAWAAQATAPDEMFTPVTPQEQENILQKYRAIKLDVFNTKDLDTH